MPEYKTTATNTQATEVCTPAISQQTQLEFTTLGHVKNAVKEVINADVVGDDPGRKLARVRFVTSSLRRHVERLFALEEHDGYMTDLAESCPHLLPKITRLRNEHDTLCESLRQIVTRLELLVPNDTPAFDALCKELLELITRLDRHTRVETELLEDAYLRDVGGEGGIWRTH